MLKLIKSLFAKKEAPEEKISLEELDSWLDKKTKPIFESLNAQISEIIGKISNEIAEANESLKTLENAQLQNPKIPERAKIIMQGNREGFIKKVSLVFNNIDLKNSINENNINDGLDYNKSGRYDELIEKCRNIESEIDSLGNSTAKNYHILNEFFAREAEKVAARIKSAENYLKELIACISGSKIPHISKIKRNITELKNKIKLKDIYSSQLENNNRALQANKNKKSEIEKNMDELKSSHGYKNYEKLLEEKEKAEIKIKEIENELFHQFSVLEKALKKYAKIAFEDENQILECLENPIIALADGADFKILKILSNLKSSIEKDELELEEKKKNKAIEKINSLDGIYFNKLKRDYQDAKKMIHKSAIEAENGALKKALNSLNEELKNIERNIGKINNEMLILSKDLEKINIGKLKEELQKDISALANAKVILLWGE